MRELVFLLEEPSAKAMLESLLPRLLQSGTGYRLIPFEGKQDLEKQLVRRIRAYQNHHARFIVLRDQDSHPDCLQLKRRLLDLCAQTTKAERCLVRLACTELETFYLGDLQAVETALSITQCAGSLGVQPEVESADAVGVLMGRLLLLDVLFKNTNRHTCAT